MRGGSATGSVLVVVLIIMSVISLLCVQLCVNSLLTDRAFANLMQADRRERALSFELEQAERWLSLHWRAVGIGKRIQNCSIQPKAELFDHMPVISRETDKKRQLFEIQCANAVLNLRTHYAISVNSRKTVGRLSWYKQKGGPLNETS